MTNILSNAAHKIKETTDLIGSAVSEAANAFVTKMNDPTQLAWLKSSIESTGRTAGRTETVVGIGLTTFGILSGNPALAAAGLGISGLGTATEGISNDTATRRTAAATADATLQQIVGSQGLLAGFAR